MRYDIITFGSGSQDIYLDLPAPGAGFCVSNGNICFNFGSKIKSEKAFFSSGGGGTNTAATFARQGLRVAYCGAVGNDCLGSSIIGELKKRKIITDLVRVVKAAPTNLSVILGYPGQDKTILVYRGASDFLNKKDIPWDKLKKTDWFYLAPFSGRLAGLTEYLVDFAKANKIKVAMNPGYNQLKLPESVLKNVFKKTDVLILNQEEASLVTKISHEKEKEIFKKLDKIVSGICIMTKGAKGVIVSDGEYLYKAKALKTRIIDSTGAGDSFSAGFLSGLIREKDIPYAIRLGVANAAYNLREIGAKNTLLLKNQSFRKTRVLREKL